MLLEIAIVVISFNLFEEYNEHRNRTLQFGLLAEKVDEIPAPADITASFGLLVAFAVISIGFDLYELIEAYNDLPRLE